ncbi:hypothetical protein MtrunA17_Chr4g0025161 [Medicago truncatula]|uniref:VQ domain-containing protein n=1 Tax=Medicago truncatula TaxID=3880 RepID=A0A072UJW2_MEDTR|nr:protein HAIKU1 [Medicago truncatula]KEH29711.1 hypothetical protein MTR_4g049970 [Medicago truncatula]RHN60377.1 hypothetical protein MtrunA17_Chr4g0025161 [Medicago truncatula]
MKNSKKHDERLGVNEIRKNKRKIYFQETIDVANNSTTSQSNFYEVHKDEFKSLIKNITGNESNASRQPVPVQFSPPVPRHHVHPISGPLLVNNSQSNLSGFPVSTSMRNFQDSTPLNIGNSRGNQFQPYPPQSQALNNTNVQNHPIFQSQKHYYPINHSSQLVNGIHSSQTNYSNQLVKGFPSTQTNVSNLSTSFHATNPTFNVNTNNQLVNGFPSSPKYQENVTRLQKIRPPPLSTVRIPISVKVPAPVPPSQAPYNALLGHHVQPITRPSLVYNSQNNLVESPVSSFMRNFQDPTLNLGNSRGNQFQLWPPQPKVFNNINVQHQPIIQSQEHLYPMNGSNQVVNGFHSSQTNGSNQLVNGFPSTQTNVSNPSVFLNATSSTLPMNISNQLVNGYSSSQTEPLSQTSEFMLTSPKSNMNHISPQSPHRPLLSPSLFSSPSSPEYPFYSHLIPDPPSPISSNLFPYTTSPKRPDYQ